MLMYIKYFLDLHNDILNFDCWIYDNLVDLSIPSNMKKKLRLQHLQLIRQRLSYDNAGYAKDFAYDKAGDAKDMA